MKIIAGCWIRMLFLTMLLITLLMFGDSVAAKEITVDDDGDADFVSIQTAIDTANKGDTVLVYPGTYSENIDANKELTIIAASEDSDDTIVRPNNPNDHGFHVTADGVEINGFTVTGGYYGIYCDNVQYNRICNNRLSNNTDGINLWHSCNNDLSNNIVNSNKRYGIYLFSSCSNNDLVDNTAYANNVGIDFLDSSNNVLKNNAMFKNTHNFGVRIGTRDGNMQNDIDTSNSVNGRAIYYLVNISDATVDTDSNAATVYCLHCQNITIRDLILKDNRHGICLYNTSNSLLENNTLSNNDIGIFLGTSSNNNSLSTNQADLNNGIGIALDFSSNNEIINNTANLNIGIGIQLDEANKNRLINNTANWNNDYGIYLGSSKDNMLEGNIIVSNGRGIIIDRSNNNEICGNILLNNSEGLRLPDSDNNTIYNNYFNNTNNIRSDHIRFYQNNSWSINRTNGMNIVGGPYLGGNFWADPYGTGFSQKNNDSNDDGFCDSPYTIGDDNHDVVDQLPLYSKFYVVDVKEFETTLIPKDIVIGAQGADEDQTKKTPSFGSLLAIIAFVIVFLFIRTEQE